MTLHDRCKAFLQKLSRDSMLRQGNPVEDLVAFVIAEEGRTADWSLDKSLPLCLYFGTEQEREDFIATVQATKPSMMTKKMP